MKTAITGTVLGAAIATTIISQQACKVPEPVRPIVDAAIDCLAPALRSIIDPLINKWQELFFEGKVELGDIRNSVKKEAPEVAACFIIELAQAYLGGGHRTSDNAWDVYYTAQSARLELVGDRPLKTMCTRADGTREVCEL